MLSIYNIWSRILNHILVAFKLELQIIVESFFVALARISLLGCGSKVSRFSKSSFSMRVIKRREE